MSSNLSAIRKRIQPGTDVIAVLKANAYGHGAEAISRALYAEGVRDFAVATLGEALDIRPGIPDARILVLMGCEPGQEPEFRNNRLTASVHCPEKVPQDVPVEVEIDTGMSRLGIRWETADRFLASFNGPLVGVFSHFACSDEDEELTRLQLNRFLTATSGVQARRHISNSGGLSYPEASLDAVRPGLALYGIAPCPSMTDLQPIMEWKCRVLTVRDVPAGSRIGYSGTFTADRDSLIAVLPIGYADGFSRSLSNRGMVRVRGRLAPIVGRISMDLTTVDVTDVPDAGTGDEVTVLENDPSSPISAASVAQMTGTIAYEVLTSISPRVERVYVE